MAGQFREPGRAERLEVAAFEALIEAEHTEARRQRRSWGREYEGAPIEPPTYAAELRRLGPLELGPVRIEDYWPAEPAATHPARVEAARPDETTQER